MYTIPNNREASINKSMFRELPYFGIAIINVHGQFNKSHPSCSFAKTYLDKLPSIYDIDLFSLNTPTNSDINPNNNIFSNHIRSQYYSPLSFQKFTNKLENPIINSSSSIFHNNTLKV